MTPVILLATKKYICLYIILKQLFLSIWLLTILLQVCSKVVFISWFSTHQIELEESCCVNKRRPELNCKAKCFLTKQLNQLDENNTEKSSPNKIKSGTEEVLFLESPFYYFVPGNTSATAISSFQPSYHFQYSISVFQPPKV